MINRGVAEPGHAPASEAGARTFESCPLGSSGEWSSPDRRGFAQEPVVLTDFLGRGRGFCAGTALLEAATPVCDTVAPWKMAATGRTQQSRSTT